MLPSATLNSTITEETAEDSYDEGKSTSFDMLVGVYLPGLLCLLGIGGNILSLLVLRLDRTNSLCFYSLRALSLSDIILLSSALVEQIIPMYHQSMHEAPCDINERFCWINGYMVVYAWPIICMAQMSSIWLTVLISTERFFAVCHPFKSVQLRSIKKLRTAILVIFIGSTLYNIPKFFEFRLIEVELPELNITTITVAPTPLRMNHVYRYLYNTATFCLLVYAMPLMVLLLFNTKIILEMRRANKEWSSLQRTQQKEVKATVMPLSIMVVFITCSTQALLAFILDAVYLDDQHAQSWLYMYTGVVNLLVITNASINFLIFYLFGERFRKLLRRFLGCRKERQKKPLTRFGWSKVPIRKISRDAY